MRADSGRMTDSIRKCFHFIGRGRRGRWLLLMLLALVASGFEAGAALLVFALLGIITSSSGGPAVPPQTC